MPRKSRKSLVALLVVFSVFMFRIMFVRAELDGKNFISWEDMKLNDHLVGGLDIKDRFNQSRIIVVDKNGTGDSLTVQGAIDMVPEHNTQRVKILVLPGIYREKVVVPATKPFISMIGNLSRVSDTVITWNNKASDKDSNGVELGTYNSASVTIQSDYFCATGITFENTVVAVPGGYGMQAVALRVSGNKAMFHKIRVLGTQDTLLDESGVHYFYQCYIQGSVDFIFGRSKSLYEDCLLHSTAKKFGAIAAHHRDSPLDDTGFSFLNCSINGTGDNYLGRAWGNYSRIVYAYCSMENIITPSGWSDWHIPNRQKTVTFGQYECRGSGSNTTQRVPWSKSFSYEEAKPYLDKNFINGQEWLRL